MFLFRRLVEVTHEQYQKELDECFSGGDQHYLNCRDRRLAVLSIRDIQGREGHL